MPEPNDDPKDDPQIDDAFEAETVTDGRMLKDGFVELTDKDEYMDEP